MRKDVLPELQDPRGGRDPHGAHRELLLLDLSAGLCSVWRTFVNSTLTVCLLFYCVHQRKKERSKLASSLGKTSLVVSLDSSNLICLSLLCTTSLLPLLPTPQHVCLKSLLGEPTYPHHIYGFFPHQAGDLWPPPHFECLC